MVGDMILPKELFNTLTDYNHSLWKDYASIRAVVWKKEGRKAARNFEESGDKLVLKLMERAKDTGVFTPLRDELPSVHWGDVDKTASLKLEQVDR